jgi:hypothetical protein
LFLAISIPEAKADSITYNLAVTDSSALGTLASYGTVRLDLVAGGGIKFTVTAAPGLTFVQQGFGFNGGVSVVGSLPTGYSLQSHNFDGFGSFNNAIGGPNSCSGQGLNQLVFTVTSPGGFTSVSQLDQNNAGGHNFAARLAGPNGTAFVTVEAIPEPGSLVLLSTGAAALGLLTAYSARRRKSSELLQCCACLIGTGKVRV